MYRDNKMDSPVLRKDLSAIASISIKSPKIARGAIMTDRTPLNLIKVTGTLTLQVAYARLCIRGN